MRVSPIAVLVAGLVATMALPARSSAAVGHFAHTGPLAKVGTIPVGGVPNSYTVGPDGNVWFGASTNEDTNTGFMGRLVPQTYQVSEYNVDYVIGDDAPTQVLTTNDRIYFIAEAQGSDPSILGTISTTGSVTLQYDAAVAGGINPFTNNQIVSIVNSSGTSFAFAESNGSYFTLPVPVPSGYASATAGAPKLGPNGDLWYCQMLSGPSVGGIGAATKTGKIVLNIPLGPNRCQELEYGPDGNVWTADPSNNELLRVTPKGHLTDYRNAMNVSRVRADPIDGSIWFVASNGSQTSIDEFSIATKNITPYNIAGIPSGDTIKTLYIDHAHKSVWFSEDGSTPVNAVFRLVLK